MSKHVTTLCVLVGAAACGDDGQAVTPDAGTPTPDVAVDAPAAPFCQPKALRADLAWAGTNRTDLQNWLASHGCTRPGYNPGHKPVALFDWDNTVTKNEQLAHPAACARAHAVRRRSL